MRPPAPDAGITAGRMSASFAPSPRRPTLSSMASIAARSPRRHRPGYHGPRLFEGPVVFRRTRLKLTQLAGLVWLAAEIARLARSRRA
jgi:hypothetical protein